MSPVNLAILTVSDRCSNGEAEDKSGPAIKQICLRESFEHIGTCQWVKFVVLKEECVPDEVDLIEDKLREWSKQGSLINVILTTGGTGFAPRDVTPEATLRVVDRLCPAITTAITVASLKETPNAMLSRSVSGIKNSTLIVNLPGSVKGARECLHAILPCLNHATHLLRDDKSSVEKTHSAMNQSLETLCSKVSGFKVADRQRISPWPMISMDHAIDIVLGRVPVLDSETVLLSECLGRVISENVHAEDYLPPFRASVKDGYAVVGTSGTGDYRVVSALTAGCSPEGLPDLGAKECVRVNTGGPIPYIANAVVQVEDTQLVETDDAGNELVVRILVEPKLNQDIRPIGSDIPKGSIVLSKGDEIRSSEAGILAAVGVTTVPVFKLPGVAVLSTGNELVPAGKKLVPGAVRDSNMTTIRALLAENGFSSHDMGIVRDQPDALLKVLRRCLTVADVVITTGSVSMGERDYLKDVLLHDFHTAVTFGRVNMKPGKPTAFAPVLFNGKTKFVFALPGNPASAATMTHLLVLPALKKMSGHGNPRPTRVSVVMDFEAKLDEERPEYRRAILSFNESGTLVARSTGSQISSRLLSWRAANALLVLPSKKEEPSGILSKGSRVQAFLLNKI